MTIRKKDFQRIVSYIEDFLDRLSQDDLEAAELRDSFSYALWQMRNYYKTLRSRSANSASSFSPKSSMLGLLNPLTWKWLDLGSAVPSLGESYGFRKIHQAAKEGDVETIKQLLLEDPLLVNSQDCMGRTPIMYCAHYAKDEHLECIKLLLSFEANTSIKTKDSATVVHHAVYGGNHEILELILQKELQSINSQDNMGRSPVHLAVMREETDCLKLLLDNNALYSMRDIGGLTPIMWACNFDRQYHLCILQSRYEQEYNNSNYLLEERDHQGRTAIHWAVMQRKSIYCLQSLLTSSAISLTDQNGRTVLHTASLQGSVNACKYVLNHHPEVINNVDKQMRTALHLATLAGHGDVINLLLDHKAISNIVDEENSTALDLALSKKLHYCIIVLNSFNRQSEKDGFRTPLRPKNKLHNLKKDYKSPNNRPSSLQGTVQPKPFSSNPLPKPRSLTSPYPISDSSDRSLFFAEHEKSKEKIIETDQKETAKSVKEQSQKQCKNLLFLEAKSLNSSALHLKRGVGSQSETSSRDGMSSTIETKLQSPKDCSNTLNESNSKNSNQELELGNNCSTSSFGDYNEGSEVSITVPETLAKLQKLSSKSFSSSSRQRDKNSLSSLSNLGKESGWPGKSRVRSFTASESTNRERNISRSNGLLSKIKTSSGDELLVVDKRKCDDNDTWNSNSTDTAKKEGSIRQKHFLHSDLHQNAGLKRDKAEFTGSPRLLAPINRPKSRSFSGITLR